MSYLQGACFSLSLFPLGSGGKLSLGTGQWHKHGCSTLCSLMTAITPPSLVCVPCEANVPPSTPNPDPPCRRVVDGDLLQHFLQLPRSLQRGVVSQLWARMVRSSLSSEGSVELDASLLSATWPSGPVAVEGEEGAEMMVRDGPQEATGAAAAAEALRRQLHLGEVESTRIHLAVMEMVQRALALVPA